MREGGVANFLLNMIVIIDEDNLKVVHQIQMNDDFFLRK